MIETELTLADVNRTATRVASFGVATHNMATRITAKEAVSLIAHWGMLSGLASAAVAWKKRRFRYSLGENEDEGQNGWSASTDPNMRAMMALEPGLRTEMAVHEKR